MSDKLDRITGTESIKKYFDTDYIGAYSIDEGMEPILTIEGIYHGDLTLIGGRKEHHVVLKFKESRVTGIDEVKPMILNSTNRQALKKVYGSDSAAVLEGKRIQLYIDPKVRNPSDGELGPALRIRAITPKPAAPAAPTPAPVCADCKQPIPDHAGAPARHIAASTNQKYGRPLCYDCSQIAKAAMEAQMAEGGTPNAN